MSGKDQRDRAGADDHRTQDVEIEGEPRGGCEGDGSCHACDNAAEALAKGLPGTVNATLTRRHLLAGAVETAAARQHRVGGEADRVAIGEQRRHRRHAFGIVR